MYIVMRLDAIVIPLMHAFEATTPSNASRKHNRRRDRVRADDSLAVAIQETLLLGVAVLLEHTASLV
jgi:hypothetical protein